MSDFLTNFAEDLKTNVAGFIAVAVTEIKTGMSYTALSVDPSFDAELAAAYNLEVVKAKISTIKALNLNQEVEDIMITLTNQIHIISVSTSGEYFIYLAVDSTKANLGLTRAILKKYSREIESKL
jgi:predicted regulator of Ras-like GTPase activity (Roadblock/LC7/MglB family)